MRKRASIQASHLTDTAALLKPASELLCREGMALTSRIASEVALRLSRNEGRPGAFTPAALFGPELAEAAGAESLIS